jgi:hypothetical protein
MPSNTNNDEQEYQQFLATTFSTTLKSYSAIQTASVFSALSLNPNFQSSQYRLEKAISICLSFCKGNKKPDLNLVKFILEKSSELFSLMEDPAEDVFISTLWFEDEQYKVGTGLWEGGIYQTQIFLDFFESGKDDKKLVPIRHELKAILKASDLVITKLKLSINEIGAEYPIKHIDYDLLDLDELVNNVKLQSFDKVAFLPCIDVGSCSELYKQELGESDLEAAPFFADGDNCYLILPSAILACIKRHIVNFVRKNYTNETLNFLFLNFQARKIYETRLLREFEYIPVQFSEIKDVEGWSSYEAIIEFDEGYFLHFIFLAESLNSLGDDWFNGFSMADISLSKYIEESVSNAKSYVLEKRGGRKGFTILVPCSYGTGLGIGLNVESNSQWMLETIYSHDLDTISNDTDCTPHKIWRIVESLCQLTAMGVRLLNPNGFLNLYAYAKENDYCLVPHESFQELGEDSPNILMIGFNYQAKLRQQILKETETLSIQHYKFGMVKVIRGFNDSLFSNNKMYDIYVPEQVDKNVLQCVYVNEDYELWIEQDVVKDYDFSWQFQCFKAALSWIQKIITVIKNVGLLIPEDLQVWHLSFNFSEDIGMIKNCPKSEDILSCFSNEFISPVLYSTFGTEFFDGLRHEDNLSEQALVLSLVNYICDFNQVENCSEILNKVIESPSARHIHSFVAKQYREFFIPDTKEPIHIEKTDDNNIKLNLGWICRDRSQGNVIEGKEECKKYFYELVGSIWEIIKKKLQIFDREFLIYTLFVNMEHSDHQKERWKRTFKANLALQNDKENLYAVVKNKLGLLNGASLSSRLVIEMALCECPLKGGKKAGILDIQELMCLASMMHHFGGVSEAINYDAIEPKVVISVFGDVMFYHDFNDTILEPYLNKFNENDLSASVKKYAKHLIEEEAVESVNHLFDDEFSKAWMDEFGFTIDDARLFIDRLEDYGFHKNELVYKISYQELLKLFDATKIAEVSKRIIQELVIYPRDSWNTIPTPFKPADSQPWRFRRRFSLMMRPIVQFDDATFLISPQHIRNSFFYLVRSCHSAALDENHFISNSMKKLIGKVRKTNGLEFNTTVANKLEKLGWTVREEIKLTEVLNKKLEEDWGDIDVLAWNKQLQVVAVIECKDLDFAKTQSEIARQLHEFKGQKNEKGKKDRLLKHVCRIKVLNDNLDKFSKFTGITFDESIGIKGYAVFSNNVPMVFNDNRLYKDEIEFLTFDQLENLAISVLHQTGKIELTQDPLEFQNSVRDEWL